MSPTEHVTTAAATTVLMLLALLVATPPSRRGVEASANGGPGPASPAGVPAVN
ncbi:hypothetical protein pipiens_009431, partial [Culex pipiens pipiens]